MIRITAKKDGFRRAGVFHAGTCDYPDGRFTPAQLVMLQAEPLLVVDILPTAEPVQVAEESAPPAGKPEKAVKPEKPESA